MFALHKGNEASGGLRVVAQPPSRDGPLPSSPRPGRAPRVRGGHGPDAVIARGAAAPQRAARLARRNAASKQLEPVLQQLRPGTARRAPPPRRGASGGRRASATRPTRCLSFPSTATQSVRRRGAARSRRGRRAGGGREAECAPRSRRSRPRRGRADRRRNLLVQARGAGAGDAPISRQLETRVASTRARRQVGERASAQADHRARVFSARPERRLGDGKKGRMTSPRAKRAELKKEAEAEAEAARQEPSYFAREIRKFRRSCAEGARRALFTSSSGKTRWRQVIACSRTDGVRFCANARVPLRERAEGGASARRRHEARDAARRRLWRTGL